MPQSGRNSLGSFGRRLVGVIVDWAIATIIAAGLFRAPLPFSAQATNGSANFTALGVFAVMNLLLVATLGFTIGHRLVGLQVRSLSGSGRVLPSQAFARTVLLCLFIPAVIWDKDGRGLHDKAANTVIVRAR